MKDNRALTILKTANGHLSAGQPQLAIQVIQAQIDAMELELEAERRRDREYHGDVRSGHPHKRIDVGVPHYHRNGRPDSRMLPIKVEGDR